MIRIGQGFDVHQLVEGRRCVIGGVDIPHEKGLAGHSDADVLLHAICDALLGAAALGDRSVEVAAAVRGPGHDASATRTLPFSRSSGTGASCRRSSSSERPARGRK